MQQRRPLRMAGGGHPMGGGPGGLVDFLDFARGCSLIQAPQSCPPTHRSRRRQHSGRVDDSGRPGALPAEVDLFHECARLNPGRRG